MSSMSHIESVKVVFDEHTSDKKLATALNNFYSDDLPNLDRIFVDPLRENLLDSTPLNTIIRKIIIEEMVAPYATNTPDPINTITPLINQAALFVIDGNYQSRLTKESLFARMKEKKNRLVVIKVSTHHLNHDYDAGELDVTDWTTYVSKPLSRKTSFLSAADIATAVAQAIPAPTPPTPFDHVAFANALTTAITPLVSVPTTSTSATSSTTSSLPVFYTYTPPASLPSDVRLRYDNFIARKLLPGSTPKTPYSNGHFYFDEGDKLFLPNGQLFFSNQAPNEKALMKLECYCKNNTRAGIRSWYTELTRELFTYGFYLHPKWNFRRDHGGPRGFTIGPDKDDDLPDRMRVPIDKMSGPIYRYLKKSNMFPRSSRLHDTVAGAKGDGYVAICSILRHVLPVFQEEPSCMLVEYPKQGNSTLQEYFNSFVDYQQLRANVMDFCLSLDNSLELDIFIRNSTHHAYLNRVTRDERRQATYKHRYSKTQILQTLQTKLTASDSPLMLQDSETLPPRPFLRQLKSAIKVQTMETSVKETEDEEASNYESDYTYVADEDEDEILVSLNAIQVPEDKEKEYHDYCACVHAIKTSPQLAFRSKCIVCGGEHTFDNCSVLQNHAFLKGHYIRYCQQLKRDRAALENMGAATTSKGRKQRFSKESPGEESSGELCPG